MSECDNQKTRTLILPPEGGAPEEAAAGHLLEKMPVKSQERYRFIRSIGFGGMKGVLLVHDRDTDREVAMAVMPDYKQRPRADLERFVEEAYLTASLEHPNIVPVHDVGITPTGAPYFTMKFLRGQSLAKILRDLAKGKEEAVKRYDLERLLQFFIRICNALDFAHSRGVCHLDLKPENVNVGNFGEVLVLDWGLARSWRKESAAPAGRKVQGTLGYMSPEQLEPDRFGPVSPRSDVYALGALLYAMLTLKSPLKDLPPEEMVQRTLSGDVPSPGKAAPADRHVPAALAAICRKAMAPDPAKRYASAQELKEDIQAFRGGFVPKAEKASPLKRAGLFIGRNLLILLILLNLMLLAGLLLLWFGYVG